MIAKDDEEIISAHCTNVGTLQFSIEIGVHRAEELFVKDVKAVWLVTTKSAMAFPASV